MKHRFSKLLALSFLVLLPLSLDAGDGFIEIKGGQATRDATGQSAKLATTTSGSGDDRVDTLKTDGGGGGGGGGGDASAANQTAVQANAGSNASKATAVQGIDSGKPVSVSQTGAQYTIEIQVNVTVAIGDIAAGKHHIEIIFSSDFTGSVQGQPFDGATISVWDPGALPAGSTFDGVDFELVTGTMTITTW